PPNATVKLKFADLDQLFEWVERVRAAKSAAKPPAETKAGLPKAKAKRGRASKVPDDTQPGIDSTGPTAPDSEAAKFGRRSVETESALEQARRRAREAMARVSHAEPE
ncbi:MAG: hypothetical protein ABSG53_21460, partial [Thermoguttaceae bacterium]